jgi:thiamine-phosphate pyrophosphorylase
VKTIRDRSLYLVISEEYAMGRSALEVARRAIAGGVDMIQMREKARPDQELVGMAKALSALCRRSGAIFIVNDDPSLARRADADGVHLGQGDMARFPVKTVRGIVGPDRLIGVSTHSLDELRKAMDEDIDYLAFGPVFPTKTKDYSIGTEDVKRAAGIARKPVFFIGGIDLSNIDIVLGEGGRNIALIRAITEADDIETRTRRLKERIVGHKEAGVA